ncbi:MAG TPA: LysR family transcriptional regulator [Polyangiaceae bacterium]|jgi:DNA-binding transcriptional LysR family regulator
MDLNLLSTFVVVAETSSFSLAAKRLGVIRSSVSRSVSALERELGVQLFSRSTRHVAMTSAGRALHEKIAPALASMKAAVGALPEREELPSGTLCITAPLDIGALVMPRVLAAFSVRHPAVQLDMRLSNRQVDLVAEGFDAALRVLPPRRGDSSLVARKLTDLEMAVFASPIYLARAGTPRTVEESVAHAWVSFGKLKPTGDLAPLGKVTPRWIGDDVAFVSQAVLAGVGLGLVPTFLVREQLTAGTVVRVLPRVTARVGALHLVYPPTRHLPRKVSALRDFLVEHFASYPLTSASAST